MKLRKIIGGVMVISPFGIFAALMVQRFGLEVAAIIWSLPVVFIALLVIGVRLMVQK